MKRIRLHIQPTHLSDITFDELYDEVSSDWQRKAEALQARRWHHVKKSMKGGRHAAR